MRLDEVLQRADVWRGGAAPPVTGLSTGFAVLDVLLPGSGWPNSALTEILLPHEGIGELRLLVPTLARLRRQERWITFVAPPHIPYAPALAHAGIDLTRVLRVHPRTAEEQLWAIEQALHAGAASTVLAWLAATSHRMLRRLQLAAEAGTSWGVLFRPERAAADNSPAALRLRLEPAPAGVSVHVVKRRGGWPTGPVALRWTDGAPAQGSVTAVTGRNHALAMHSPSGSRARSLYPRQPGA